MNKFTLVAMKDELFSAIFAINNMYMDITYFVWLSMLIQCVLKFHKILLPFLFNKSISFKNSKSFFKL
jgi:hypothetical protein